MADAATLGLAATGGPQSPLEGAPLALALEDIAFLLVFFGLGLLLVYGGFDRWRAKRLLEDTATETVQAAAIGQTELKGTARQLEAIVDRPFTEGQALYVSWKIEEYRSDDDGGDWHTIESGGFVRPFLVDDGTGQMVVDPTDGAPEEVLRGAVDVSTAAVSGGTWELSEDNRDRFVVGSNEQEPPIVRDFVVTHTDEEVKDEGWIFGDKRRYTQEYLPPGEDVYVFGGVRERANASGDNAERLVMGADEASGRFIISDMTEEELTSKYTWQAPVMMLLGLAMSAGTLYVLLTNL